MVVCNSRIYFAMSMIFQDITRIVKYGCQNRSKYERIKHELPLLFCSGQFETRISSIIWIDWFLVIDSMNEIQIYANLKTDRMKKKKVGDFNGEYQV